VLAYYFFVMCLDTYRLMLAVCAIDFATCYAQGRWIFMW